MGNLIRTVKPSRRMRYAGISSNNPPKVRTRRRRSRLKAHCRKLRTNSHREKRMAKKPLAPPILPSPDPVSEQPKENISFIVIHSKTKYDVEFPLNDTVEQLKLHLQTLTGKIYQKGALCSKRGYGPEMEIPGHPAGGISSVSYYQINLSFPGVPQKLQKVMYKGGLAKDEKSLKEIGVVTGAKLMLVGSKMDEVMTVLSSTSNLEPLPPCPLSGMLNKSGGKVRLTFKLELDQLWIGTKERTDKVAMASIKSIVSEPIEGKEQYHIM
ncbi:unnamed protein product, partial [Nesidiocoris tenuis]